MNICKIDVSNFRGIKNASILVSKNAVFVGDNNSGKSTLFEAIDWPIRNKEFTTLEELIQKELHNLLNLLNRRFSILGSRTIVAMEKTLLNLEMIYCKAKTQGNDIKMFQCADTHFENCHIHRILYL